MTVARASIALSLIVFSLLGARHAAAQWTSLGPDGGSVSAVITDPSDPNRVYVSGDGGVFRSVDAGAHWVRAETGLLAAPSVFPWTELLASDADQPATLYLADRSGRIYRSTDAAVNWTATGFDAPGIDSLVALVDLPGTVGHLLLATGDGVLSKSTDSGSTFAPLETLGVPVTHVAVDPANAARVLVVTAEQPPQVLLSTNGGDTFVPIESTETFGPVTATFGPAGRIYVVIDGRVMRTDDSGTTWSGSFGSGDITDIAVDPSTPGRIFVAETGKLLVSNDGGTTQTPVTISTPARTSVLVVAVQPRAALPARIWLGSAGSGLIASDDGGASFTARNAGLRSTPVRSVALHPFDRQRMVAGMFVDHSNGSQSAPLQSTTDGGATWNSGLYAQAGYLRGLAIDPVTATNPSTTHIYAVGRSPAGPASGQNGGIYKSTDGGASWTVIDNGLGTVTNHSIGTVRNVVVDPRSCAGAMPGVACSTPLQTIYATASGRGIGAFRVVRSDNAGASWVDRSAGLPNENDDVAFQAVTPIPLVIDPVDRNILYVGTYADVFSNDGSPAVATIPNGVFRSTDGGATWLPRSTGLPIRSDSSVTAQDVFALVNHPRRAGVLWAAATPLAVDQILPSRIFKSVDAGATWFESSTGLDACLVRAMQVDPVAPDVIYASGSGTDGNTGCLYRSENGGATWSALHAGLPATTIGALQRDPTNQGRVVVATNSGLWETRQPPDAIFRDGNEG